MAYPFKEATGDEADAFIAFKSIAAAIDPAGHEGLMEIDLLETSMFPEAVPVLQDGSAVAINKTALKGAYFLALKGLKQASWASSEAKHLLEYDTVVEALRCLAVILLLQPEHLLAINLRKALLAPVFVEHTGVYIAKYSDLWTLEMRFIDSLLTSPLNKHNKSPTLWSHRLFVHRRVFRFGFSKVLEDLMGVVMVAGEKHPRNYYAWNHARHLMKLVDWRSDDEKEGILPAVLDWCKRHHDDTSGWSFLNTLLSTPCAGGARYEPDAVQEVLLDVTRLAYSLRWTNESVWVFLRTMAASKVSREPEYAEFLRTVAALDAGTEDLAAKRVLQAAAAWCTKYRQDWRVGV